MREEKHGRTAFRRDETRMEHVEVERTNAGGETEGLYVPWHHLVKFMAERVREARTAELSAMDADAILGAPPGTLPMSGVK